MHEVQLQGHINSVLHGGIQNIYGNLETITRGLHDAYQDDLATRQNLNILSSNFNDHVRGFDDVLRPYLAGSEHSIQSALILTTILLALLPLSHAWVILL